MTSRTIQGITILCDWSNDGQRYLFGPQRTPLRKIQDEGICPFCLGEMRIIESMIGFGKKFNRRPTKCDCDGWKEFSQWNDEVHAESIRIEQEERKARKLPSARTQAPGRRS